MQVPWPSTCTLCGMRSQYKPGVTTSPYPGYAVDLYYFHDGFQQRGMRGRACSVTVAAAGYVAPRNALTHRSEKLDTTVKRIL